MPSDVDPVLSHHMVSPGYNELKQVNLRDIISMHSLQYLIDVKQALDIFRQAII